MSRKQCRRKVWGLVNPIQHAIDRAQAGLSDAHDRFKATGRMGLSGPAIQAMRDLAEYHDLQRQFHRRRTCVVTGHYRAPWVPVLLEGLPS